VDGLLAAIEAWPVARWLRFSRFGYAAVATAHVAGIGLLLGAIVAFDLRLLGVRRDLPVVPLARLLLPLAAFGLALAIVSGALMFAIRATEYAALAIFALKMALIAAGLGHALAIHFGPGLAGLSPHAQRRTGALSLAIWLAVLICGRAIAFVTG
jgi:hypothetical protein